MTENVQFEESNSARAISAKDVVETVARLQGEIAELGNTTKATKEQVSERKGMQYSAVIAFVALTDDWNATATRDLTEELAAGGVSRAVAKRLVDRSIMAVRGSKRARTKPVEGVVLAAKENGAEGVYKALQDVEADNEGRLWAYLNRERVPTNDETVAKLAKVLAKYTVEIVQAAAAKSVEVRDEMVKAEAERKAATEKRNAEKAAKKAEKSAERMKAALAKKAAKAAAKPVKAKKGKAVPKQKTVKAAKAAKKQAA